MKQMTQAVQDLSTQQFVDLPVFPGTSWTVLAEPVPQRDVLDNAKERMKP